MKLTAEAVVVNDVKLNTNINEAQTTADNAQATAVESAKTATSYITKIDSAGIFISPENQSPTTSATGNSVKIDGTGMEVYKGGTSVAYYGDTARIGTTTGARTEIAPNELSLITNSGARAIHISGSGSQSQETVVSVTIDLSVSSGSSKTVTLSGISSGTDIEMVVYATPTRYQLLTVKIGTTSSGTYTNASNARFAYSFNGSTNVLTINANQGDSVSIPYYIYRKTVPIPLTEISGKTYIEELYLNGHTGYNVGDNDRSEKGTQSTMSAGTTYSFGNLTLPKGVYLITGQVSFGASSSSYRRVALSTSATSCALSDVETYAGTQTAASSSGVTVLQITYIANITTDNTSFYLTAISGAALSAESYGYLSYVCIG